jgi:hypothetical protein
MDTKFCVTTRIEVLQQLKNERYYLVGIDGTVPNGADLYDELYDHHRPNGAEIQMDEIDDRNLRGEIKKRLAKVEKLAFITTMVDADAQVATFYFLTRLNEIDVADSFNFLRAISYDCDHLAVPVHYQERYGKKASMVVAALKEESNKYVSDLGLSSNRREWSVEDKEKFGSYALEKGVTELIPALLNGTWNYESIAQSYWQTVEKNTLMLVSEGRISVINGVAVFDGKGLGGTYIDPRCWYRGLASLGLDCYTGIALTQREIFGENEFKGFSYTIGKIPLSKFDGDFTDGLFQELTEAEKITNPDCDGWGGRATVGGSGWNTPSDLFPVHITNIIHSWVCEKESQLMEDAESEWESKQNTSYFL